MCREETQGFSGALWKGQRQRAQTEHQEQFSHCEEDWALARVAQGSCVLSIPGDIQNWLDTILGNRLW